MRSRPHPAKPQWIFLCSTARQRGKRSQRQKGRRQKGKRADRQREALSLALQRDRRHVVDARRRSAGRARAPARRALPRTHDAQEHAARAAAAPRRVQEGARRQARRQVARQGAAHPAPSTSHSAEDRRCDRRRHPRSLQRNGGTLEINADHDANSASLERISRRGERHGTHTNATGSETIREFGGPAGDPWTRLRSWPSSSPRRRRFFTSRT